jgi:hypothetical protein
MPRHVLVVPFALVVVAVACGPQVEPRAPGGTNAPDAAVAPSAPSASADATAPSSSSDAASSGAADAGTAVGAKPPPPSTFGCPKDLQELNAHPSCADLAASARAYGMPSYACGSQLWSCSCPVNDADAQWSCAPGCPVSYDVAKTTACDPAHSRSCDYAEGQCSCPSGGGKFKCAAQCPPSFAQTKTLEGKPCDANAVCSFAEGPCVCGQKPFCGGVQPDPHRPKIWTCYGPRPDGCPGTPKPGTACAAGHAPCVYCASRTVCDKGKWREEPWHAP